MKSKRPYKEILIFLGVVITLLFASHYFLYTDIKRKNENISSLKQEAAHQLKRNQYLLNLQKTFQNTDSDIARINNSIISSDGNIEFIEDLESTARADGLSIAINSLVFEEDPSVSSGNITIFRVKAETNGSWDGTYKFLAELESMPLKVKINSFGLTNSTQNPSPGSKSSKPISIWHSSLDINVLKYK